MKKELRDIREFYKAVGAESQFTTMPTANIPSNLKDVRQNLILEEVTELFKAMNDQNLVEILDAILDIQYVVLGTALTYGLEHRMVAGWKEVQRSNMAKVGPDGKVNMRPDGKIIKPEGWTPPDLEGVLKPKIFEELDAEATRLESLASSMWSSYNMADTQTRHERESCEGYDKRAKAARDLANKYKGEEKK